MKYIYTFLFSIIILQANGQEFPLKSSKWHYTNSGGLAPPNTHYSLVEYDTSIMVDGYLGRKLKYDQMQGMGLTGDYIFRYSNDSVFAVNQSGTWGLLYVFSAIVGDTIPFYDFYNDQAGVEYRVDSVLVEMYDSTNLKRFKLSPADVGTFGDWEYIERIGAHLFYPNTITSLPEQAVLRCYSDSTISEARFYGTGPCDAGNPFSVEESYYEKNILVYPIPASAYINIQYDLETTSEVELIDLKGTVQSNLSIRKGMNRMAVDHIPPGMYVLSFREKDSANHFHRRLIMIE